MFIYVILLIPFTHFICCLFFLFLQSSWSALYLLNNLKIIF